ncbi:zinc-binding dehydrogenase [Priestia megaterium]|uniref:zinc-binding dehydrogenase n=1 Tax=Priestia megaterium TaxID=1404 RepID=UPI0013E38320|nr:zinc-binding dehydrogenase [Priestia megaterium]MED3863480.1 zinc-binding dehydrogenase [Priestia megaterium]MED4101464.1 zinc-binding dehydrogenase [Priestia megaterium]MED4144983.1 zinc-binding dehydrogenase [Priestia megaterium]MED4170041.1 zinc-binding dehydrogenase [Priestia megaterium]MED4199397.1 zinc-binding dehydrogenase [Priestia megaterium]
MKAVMKVEPGYDKMLLKTIPELEVQKNQVKIKVAYTGICGTDIHTFTGQYKNSQTPVVLGHEFSGIVVEVGEDVTKVKVGDKVTSETTFVTCGECDYCLEKDYNLCAHRKGIGTQINGSFAEYVISREESVHVLPDAVDLKAAALTEPLACCVHAALEKTVVKKEDKVLIFGPGPIGLLQAQVVKAQGAFVILAGITKDQKRLELAKSLGVDIAVDIQKESLEEIVLAYTNGYGVDQLFECSGAVQALNQGLPLVKKKGTFVQVGIFSEKLNLLDQESIIQREITYIGTRSQKPSSWHIALKLLEEKKINTEKMITKIVPLDYWRQGFEAVLSGNEIKVLVQS